jgi:hypothetical protein
MWIRSGWYGAVRGSGLLSVLVFSVGMATEAPDPNLTLVLLTMLSVDLPYWETAQAERDLTSELKRRVGRLPRSDRVLTA